MLGKLLKYEVKATSMVFMFLYMAILGLAIFNRLFDSFKFKWGTVLTGGILFGLFVALGVITIIMAVQRFNKNLLGDEGYLMFTLPVNTKKIIISKLLVTLMWSVVSGIVAILTFVILFSGNIQWSHSWSDLMNIINEGWVSFDQELIKETHMTAWEFVIGISIGVIVSYIECILMIYGSLTVAQLPALSKHRGIAAFGTFFVLNVVVNNILMSIIAHIIDFNSLNPAMLIWGGIGLAIVISIGLFFLIDVILSKHLNLE